MCPNQKFLSATHTDSYRTKQIGSVYNNRRLVRSDGHISHVSGEFLPESAFAYCTRYILHFTKVEPTQTTPCCHMKRTLVDQGRDTSYSMSSSSPDFA